MFAEESIAHLVGVDGDPQNIFGGKRLPAVGTPGAAKQTGEASHGATTTGVEGGQINKWMLPDNAEQFKFVELLAGSASDGFSFRRWRVRLTGSVSKSYHKYSS
jgi:hypothetical protein